MSFSEHQLRRGMAAALPFVHEWRPAVNPEEVELLVAMVLRHAVDAPPTAADYESIDADVRECLAEDRAARGRMLRAMGDAGPH